MCFILINWLIDLLKKVPLRLLQPVPGVRADTIWGYNEYWLIMFKTQFLAAATIGNVCQGSSAIVCVVAGKSIVDKIMGFRGFPDGCKWKCSDSAKIWAGNYWYHTQCVSGRLDHKTDFLKNCWKKINYFPREGGSGGWGVYPSMKNSMEIIFFLFGNLP